MGDTIKHEIPANVQALVGREGGKDGTFWAILGIDGTGEAKYWPSIGDDGQPMSYVDHTLDEIMAHKVERTRFAIRLTVAGNAVSVESYIRHALGCNAGAIGPNTVDVYPHEPYSVGDYLADIGRKGGAAKTSAKRAASAENGKKGGRPAGIPAMEAFGLHPIETEERRRGWSYVGDGQERFWIRNAGLKAIVSRIDPDTDEARRAYDGWGAKWGATQ